MCSHASKRTGEIANYVPMRQQNGTIERERRQGKRANRDSRETKKKKERKLREIDQEPTMKLSFRTFQV